MKFYCTVANEMCKQFLGGGDLDPVYDNTKRLNIFFAHTPNGASVRCFQHFSQMFSEAKSNPFLRKFDFGAIENYKRYGQIKAPIFDMSNIKIPVTMFHGLQDTLADPADVNILQDHLLARGVNLKVYTYNQWGHMTYNWGLNVQTFFSDLLSEIKSAQNQS